MRPGTPCPTVHAAHRADPIEIAKAIDEEPAGRSSSAVGPTREGMDYAELPTSSKRLQQVDHSHAVLPAGGRRAEDIACLSMETGLPGPEPSAPVNA